MLFIIFALDMVFWVKVLSSQDSTPFFITI